MISSKPRASILLSAYDQAHSLSLVFAGLMTQSINDFEVLLCEDEENPKTKILVEQYSARAPFAIRHFSQEHKNFRKCKILNQAIHASRSETLVFLDGDCIPHREYVEQHLVLQQQGFYIAGRRVDLSPNLSGVLSPALVEAGCFNGSLPFLSRLWLDGWSHEGSTPFHRAYMVRNPWLRRICGLEKVVDMKGCNFSVSRQDMFAINGFDQVYEGYGREDTDVEIRLQNLGLKIKSAKNLCLQFHVWHERRGFTPVNEDLLRDVSQSRRIKAINGLEQNAAT
jgi:glycosyltransferase involved in cell wall biosynthesis